MNVGVSSLSRVATHDHALTILAAQVIALPVILPWTASLLEHDLNNFVYNIYKVNIEASFDN